MSKYRKQAEEPILKSAASLWKYLKKSAGMDSLFYDRDLLEGTPATKGLYGHLGITGSPKNFEKYLQEHSIGVERLIVAFFKTLQPYSQMMSDICVFFEKHFIKQTNQNLRIVFDFDETKNSVLEFDLEHFKQVLEKISKAKRLLQLFSVNRNQLWKMPKLFTKDYLAHTNNPEARTWIDRYRNQSVFNPPDIELPATGNVQLDYQLGRILTIWQSFVNACRNISPNRTAFRKILGEQPEQKRTDTEPWDGDALYTDESDFWPGTFLNCMFYRLEELALLQRKEREIQQKQLTERIEDFLSGLPVTPIEEGELIREFIDLLQLPVWKKRFELYAAWILTLIDQVFDGYTYQFYHREGLLSLTFSATHLATINTDNGVLELWSEVRSPVKNPSGSGRKNNIQPDYALYSDTGHVPGNCLAVVEVKQYRTASISSFKKALNDYTKGLPNAHVFLVNYGGIPERLGAQLDTPGRSHFFGQIRPLAEDAEPFKSALKELLPVPGKSSRSFSNMTQYDLILLLGTTIDHLFIDVSLSLNSEAYKEFLKKLLTPILSIGKVRRLAAVDHSLRREWMNPVVDNIKELLSLSFTGATEFIHLLPLESNIVIVTDNDGIQAITSSGVRAYVIEYFANKEPEFTFYDY